MSSWLYSYFSSSFYIRHMTKNEQNVQSRYRKRIDIGFARDFIKFSVERIRHFAISSAHLLRRGVLTLECSTQQAQFFQTHPARVAHTDALYFKRWTRRYRRDAVYGFSGDLPRSCCMRSPKKTAPRTAPNCKDSRKKWRDDGRGPDRMASCNSKLFQWNGIERLVDLLVATLDPSSFCSSSRTRERKRACEREGIKKSYAFTRSSTEGGSFPLF